MEKELAVRGWGVCSNVWPSFDIMRSYDLEPYPSDNVKVPLTLSPLEGPYGPMTNTRKDNFSGGVQNIVYVLMAVFHNIYP